jgi:hypothetical protein
MAGTKRVRFYKGNPVKRMRQGKDGIILTMVGSEKGQPGRQITISQTDWGQHGEWRELPVTRMDEVRQLVQG